MIKNRAIIYIHKDKFEYFDETFSKIFQFVFQPNIIQDLELVDGDELKIQLQSFVQTNKLTLTNILFVIADAIIFEKTFAISQNSNKDLEIQKFLENIPFEHVSYKIIDGLKDYKVLATNKELYSSFKFCFESMGFVVVGAIPQSSLGELYRNSQNLSSDIVKYILTHFDLLQKQVFIQEEIKPTPQTLSSNNSDENLTLIRKAPVNKYRLPALISVFVILIGILSFVVYKQFTPKTKASPVPATIVAPSLAVPTPTVQETPVSSPSAKPISL